MILASLFDVGLAEAALTESISRLGIEGIKVTVKDVMRKGIRAKSFGFSHDAETPSLTHREIRAMIEGSTLSAWVKEKSLAAFDLLAEAEALIHGVAKQDVHFHEVGSLDSIVDIVGSFTGLESLGIERITCSPLALGSGFVDCEHGRIPVPAPATLEIARGIPVRGWKIEGELTTPTGAAILRTGASVFGPVPHMEVGGIGYGAGSRELGEIPNVLRFVVGEVTDHEFDSITKIETNIDDMNPQFFSHIFDDLFAVGALDVWVENILMKKGRPGFLLCVLCENHMVSRLAGYILAATTTAGLRLSVVDRLKLARETVEVETGLGKVRVKVFDLGAEKRCAPEYEDCLQIARSKGVHIAKVIEEARNAFLNMLDDPS
jgi:uncharacterized protein (TIGR00299 family) protein